MLQTMEPFAGWPPGLCAIVGSYCPEEGSLLFSSLLFSSVLSLLLSFGLSLAPIRLLFFFRLLILQVTDLAFGHINE